MSYADIFALITTVDWGELKLTEVHECLLNFKRYKCRLLHTSLTRSCGRRQDKRGAEGGEELRVTAWL